MNEIKLQYTGKFKYRTGTVEREYMAIYGNDIVKCKIYQIEGVPGYKVLYEDNEPEFLLRKCIFLSKEDLKNTLKFYVENGIITLIGKKGPYRKKMECTIKTGM